jgi:hypothetical protein
MVVFFCPFFSHFSLKSVKWKSQTRHLEIIFFYSTEIAFKLNCPFRLYIKTRLIASKEKNQNSGSFPEGLLTWDESCPDKKDLQIKSV